MARSKRKEGTPLERLIKRSLRNGIKTIGGQDNRVNPSLASPKLLTLENDRIAFITLLQADAAHMDNTYDQGANREQFEALVDATAAAMKADE